MSNSEIVDKCTMRRDKKVYNEILVDEFQRKEEELFVETAKEIRAKSLIIDLLYDNSDLERF